MMITPHVLAGAALASLLPASTTGRIAAFCIGFGSHYLLDRVPHWERVWPPHHNDVLPKHFDDWPGHILVQGGIDTLVAVLALRYVVYTIPTQLALGVFIGGIAAALPDVFDNTPFWQQLSKKLPIIGLFEKLHRRIHVSVAFQRTLPPSTGLWTQVAAIVASSLVLYTRST